VLNLALHHPALVARAAATADLLTDGRLELGVGAGWAQAEHDATGIPRGPPGRRVDHFAAAIEVLTGLLVDGASRSTGDVVADVDRLGVQGVQRPHPPVLVGAHGRRMVRLAAQRAQIVQLTGLVPTPDGGIAAGGFGPEEVAERVAWLREDAGGRFDELELGALVQVTTVTADREATLAGLADGIGLPAEVLAESPFVLVGTTAQIVEQLEAMRARFGISYVTVRTLDGFEPVVEALAGR
jgi:probable F420-dependent oxidoreductase